MNRGIPSVTGPPHKKGAFQALIGIALALLPWLGLWLLSTQSGTVTRTIDPTSIQADGGVGYLVPLRAEAFGAWSGVFFEFPTDHAGGQMSQLRLFEGDRELGPAHSVHTDLRREGAGRFSHWDRNLYFSTGDNSDPRANGRPYRIETPMQVSRGAGFMALAVAVIGLALLWCSPPVRSATAPWRARWIAGDGDGGAAPVDGASAAGGAGSHGPLLPPRARLFLCAVWCLCAATSFWIARGEHDPYVLSTVPLAGFNDATNSLPGYSVMLDGVPRHQENMQTWDHLAMFNGSRIAADMFANRPLYPFLVSCVAWITGVDAACSIINLLAWALGTWVATRLAAEVARSAGAGVVAGMLACVGQGWWFHVNDYSSHELSFATYGLALLVIFRSRVWVARQPAETHAAVAATLGVATLCYNSGLFALAIYAVLAIWRSRWWHVAATILYAILVQRLWPPILNLLSDGAFDYYRVEKQHFDHAISMWPRNFADGSWLRAATNVAIDSMVTIAPILPLLVIGGLIVLVTRRGRRTEGAGVGGCTLLLLGILLPIVATIFYSPSATARGYLVFGGAVCVWAVAGWVVASVRGSIARGVALGLLMLGIAVQAYAVTRHAVGEERGVKLFMWGEAAWDAEAVNGLRSDSRTEVVGLAGEPAPRLAGGSVSMIESGAAPGGDDFVSLPTFKNGIQFMQMLIVRLYVLAPILFMLQAWRLSRIVAIRPRPSPRAAPVAGMALMALVTLLPPFAARLERGGAVLHRHDIHNRPLPAPVKSLQWKVEVAPPVLLRLEQLARDPSLGADILIGFGWDESADTGAVAEVFAGPVPIATLGPKPIGRHRVAVNLPETLRGLTEEPVLRVRVRRDAGIATVAAWQRQGLPGRTLTLDGITPAITPNAPFPVLELRVFPRERPYDPIFFAF